MRYWLSDLMSYPSHLWHFSSRTAKGLFFLGISAILLVASLMVLMARDKETVRELRCLSLNIYHEARGEPPQGQLAVATVTMNRVESKRFPNDVCRAVAQYGWNKKLQRHISAFSWTGDALSDRAYEQKSWAVALDIARRVHQGERHPKLHKSLHYHADYVLPAWAKQKKKITKIGKHIFYE